MIQENTISPQNPESESSTTNNENFNDWKRGDWCWLLPAPHPTDIQRQETKYNNISNIAATTATASMIIRKRTTGQYRNNRCDKKYLDDGDGSTYDDYNDDKDDEDGSNNRKPKSLSRSKKKMRRSGSNRTSGVDNDIDRSECANEEEKDACVDMEKSVPVASATAVQDDSDSDEDYTDGDDKSDCVVLTKTAMEGTKQIRYTAQQNKRWDEMFQRLVIYKNKYKSTCVPLRFEGDQELGRWVNTQRKSYKNEEISADRVDRLEQIGFVWNLLVEWDDMFQRLVDYKNECKTINVPKSYKADPKLAIWVDTQRTTYRKKELTSDRIDRLEQIGFVWNPFNVQWDDMFQRLVDYKNEFNSTNVPKRYKADTKLANWVDNQRKRYSKKELSADRINRLESIDFFLNQIDTKWDEMFQRLVDYNNEFKSTNVPRSYKADPKLVIWVITQRTRYSKKELSADRINLLESIGFTWNPRDAQWMKMYNRLVAYNQQHKSTDVPSNYKADPPLGTWVKRQRKYYRNGKLSAKRVELLEFINFSL